MAVNGKQGNTDQNQTGSMSASMGGRQSGNNGQGYSFRNLGSMAMVAMGRTPASEALSKLNKALDAVVRENAHQAFEIQLIPIDANQTQSLNISVIAVCVRMKDEPRRVAFHTLIVEQSIEPLAPRFEPIMGNQVEILRVAGDAYDKTMISEVSRQVSERFTQCELFDASATVVPRDFSIGDVEAVYNLAANTLYACTTTLAINSESFVDINLANAEHDSSLTLRATFDNTVQALNAVGQPVRSDIEVVLAAAPVQNNNGQNVERTSQIACVRGFIDLIWDPAQPQAAWGTVQQQSMQKYSARLIITQMEATTLLSLPAQLLTLVTALSLSENNTWANAFKRRPTFNGSDMHDVGALAIEANMEGRPEGFGSKIDTTLSSFRPEHLFRLITQVIKPGLTISLDIAECGPDTWINDVFSAAASGNQNANDAILDACDYLTNGAFKRHFGNGQFCIAEDTRIHMGYYIDNQGVKRDLRDIDYLAVLNLLADRGQMESVATWSDSYQNQSIPSAVREANRLRIMRGLFETVVVTGFARRVTFNPEATGALAIACKETGLTMRPVVQYADLGSYERAGNRYSGSYAMSADNLGLFNRGGSYVAGAAGQRMVSRW